MTSIAQYISDGFLILGSLLVLISSLGMLRFPDLFTRIHASSVATTFGAICVVIGLILYNGTDAVIFKLALMLLFLLFTGPTSTHALARAALEAGLKPSAHVRKESSNEEPSPSNPKSSPHSGNVRKNREEDPSNF